MAERLHSARTDRGLTRIQLARLAELNPGTIAKIESGGQAGVETIEQLAMALGVSPGWLAYGVGPQVVKSRRSSRVLAAD
jgi:transcriptional regulator with XRE-family HTH domain